MSSTRLPVLCAFAVGCLSSAVLLGVWRADSQAEAAAQKPRVQETERALPPSEQRGRLGPDSAPAPALVPAPIAARESDANSAPPATEDARDVSAPAAPGGSAVSDVLTDLEAAYRQRLIAAARAEAEAAPERPSAPPASAAPTEPPPEVAAVPSAPVAPVALVTPPAAVTTAVAPAPAAPPAAIEPQAPAAPALVAQNDARPVDIHIGDVNQNTYITNVRQGDVYVIQQQLAMLQYMQTLATPNAGSNHSARSSRGATPHQPQQFRQFPSTLTNLDNPWGFNFSPPNLVH